MLMLILGASRAKERSGIDSAIVRAIYLWFALVDLQSSKLGGFSTLAIADSFGLDKFEINSSLLPVPSS